VEKDRVIAVSGDPFGEWQRTPRAHAYGDVKIELPLMPRTFYGRPELPQASQGGRGQARRGAQRSGSTRDRLSAQNA